jgi:ribosome-binding protein aMBF1 (putative translation factor)
MTVMGQINLRSRVGIMRGQPTRKLSLEGTTASFKGGNDVVYVNNLSRTGMLLETAAPLSVGEPLQILLPEGDICAATVVWANESIFACDFARALNTATIRRIQLQSPPERRPDNENPAHEIAGNENAGGSAEAKPEEALGERIRRLRRKHGVSMVHLASCVGVSRPTLWKWEKGAVFPRQDMIRLLARTLGVSEKELIYGNQQVRQPDQQRFAALESPEKTIAAKKAEIASLVGVDPSQVKILIEA